MLDLDWDEPSASSPIVTENPQSNPMSDLLSIGGGDNSSNNNSAADINAPKSNVDDILSLFNAPSQSQQQQPQQQNALMMAGDLFGSTSPAPTLPSQPQPQSPLSSTTLSPSSPAQQQQTKHDPFADLL